MINIHRYVGHTGGCNGCLSIEGMGLENRHTCIGHTVRHT